MLMVSSRFASFGTRHPSRFWAAAHRKASVIASRGSKYVYGLGYAMWLEVNGKRMQTGNTRTMVFNVAKIISHVSHYMTLLPGDIIATGTPPGVGLGIKPTPVFLKPGGAMRESRSANSNAIGCPI